MQNLDVISVNLWQILISLANLAILFLLVKKLFYKPVKKILEKVVFPHIKRIDNEQFFDYKTKLQEYIQADYQNTLKYVVVKEVGKPNERVFTMQVIFNDIVLGEGTGLSKKTASQAAAKNALEKLAKK